VLVRSQIPEEVGRKAANNSLNFITLVITTHGAQGLQSLSTCKDEATSLQLWYTEGRDSWRAFQLSYMDLPVCRFMNLQNS